ncbi:hypothetical protein KAR91_09955 [Candidatus Pacearchaeota archaeon]|nr:hypothetical protein [Candidatus Pacearchaeota archaeon]
MADLISPRRNEQIVENNGFPTLRLIEYLEKNTLNTNEHTSQIDTNTSQIATLPFTESFTSSEQTITASGVLTLPHSLSSSPELIQARIICKTAQHGYSIGDEALVSCFGESSATTSNYGMSLVPDDTNLNIRYGAQSQVFFLVPKGGGGGIAINPANWKLIIRAWA